MMFDQIKEDNVGRECGTHGEREYRVLGETYE
jgi:hypothetical protein